MSSLSPESLTPRPVLHGLILIDKPSGMTSHDVVDAIRKIARTKHVGHAGTLDPFATGLLLIGINKGTKMLTNLVGLEKSYEATAKFGETSTTDDVDGEITNYELLITDFTKSKSAISNQQLAIPLTRDDVEHAVDSFRGGYLQTLPAYSAKRIDGKKMYNLARQGKLEGLELPKKEVKISDLHITSYEWPILSFDVSCSSGTYIRALARDIGEALHVGAHLTALRRTRIGDFAIKDAVRLDELSPRNIGDFIVDKPS